MLNFAFENLTAYMLIFVRMTGMIAFNPIFARKNIPTQVRMGFILCLTVILIPGVDAAPIAGYNEFDIVLAIFKELFIGLVFSYVFQMFYYLLFFAGDVMDTQFGLSMAKVFDPGSNVQMSISGTLLNFMFMMYIFATDSHLLLIKLVTSSYMIIPVGAGGINWEISDFMINLFITAFSLIIRMTLPFIAAEFVLEMAMGVLMKLIPQIHVFVINIQFKILLAMILLFLFAPSISGFVDNYTSIMFKSMQNVLYALAG